MKSKKKAKTISFLKRKLDAIFSKFIRQRDKGVCFTCQNTKEWKYQQSGHYISRSHNQLRYSEINTNCQCQKCNIWKHGNMDEYALALQRKYGKDILNKLNKEKQKIKQFKRQELEELIEHYKILI